MSQTGELAAMIKYHINNEYSSCGIKIYQPLIICHRFQTFFNLFIGNFPFNQYSITSSSTFLQTPVAFTTIWLSFPTTL